MKIDDIDKHILRCLVGNSRLSIRELSKQVNLSAPSVAERVRRLEEEGVIEGYSSKLNYSALGYSIQAIIQVTTRNGKCEDFRSLIRLHPNAQWCYRMAGPADYIVMLSVQKLEEIEQIIDEISVLAQTTTHIVLSEVGIETSILG
ncbi:Lrp/AsnC family leucine-responsive transcriptional regulator [Peribacillus deserti]|uniref:Lrp/AsnC family leucine-responsive transcriptional regulator n=1 Tax=Peribacillus deserti TaxID=673318 RepID=A0ABS2QHS0_9BACI|nr:Lrp/AsnC family transcriptional regulator [Peribacillus deserti]MBM7692706.1 Lrp/AsnC family leucine-responsive transcriptional regulator [Peribacillus deserti]